ncbi:hypothetical protein RSAG8_12385, partial [Rhizoctonia solani AG-8 WAC10335]
MADYLIVYQLDARAMHGMRYALHFGFDVPIPVGLIHAYMNSLETSANTIVINLSTQFLTAHAGDPNPILQSPPFGVMFDSSWLVLATWWILGCVTGLSMFVVTAVEYGGFAVFVLMLVLCVWFNLRFGDSGVGIGLAEEQEEALGYSVLPISTEI